MYYNQQEIDQACSVKTAQGTLLREVMDIESLIESGEINEATECLKCGGDKDCHHMQSQKVHDLDEYWNGVAEEKNETRHF